MVLILGALASPYLHDYDLLGVTLAVALMLRERLDGGFAPGEQAVLFAAWFIPGAMPWVPVLAHFIPVLLVLLLAMSRRRGRIRPCDSSQVPPGLPVLSAGR